MITGPQLRAARALLSMDQRQLAELCGVSLPTIRRLESANGTVGGTVDTLMKVVAALEGAGVGLIAGGAVSLEGGRGVRLKR